MKVDLSTRGANNNTMVFIYLQKGQRRKKESISLGVHGVNWRAVTKERQASAHKEKEEVERQMD